jgi:hypothetical protein
MLNVGCDSGLRGRGVAYREMSEVVRNTEQEDCEKREESGNRKDGLRTER